jgi:hypothetical protein
MGDWRFWTQALGLAADGAIAGAACAFLFGRIMRRLRPADWQPRVGPEA